MLLSLRALHESEWQLDSRQAFESSGRALRLAPRQPWARTARALVTLSAGLSEQALQELEAAHQLRGDAPRKVQRAGLRMGMAELDEARSDLKQAVTQRPADVPARLMLARLALLDGDLDEAEAELRLASQSVPGVPAVERAWAGLQAARGQHGEALGRARASLESRPDMHGHLLVAQLYLAAGDGDRARDTAREALLMVPSYRRADLTEQLQRGLGLELSDDSGEQDSLGADLPAVSPDAVVQPGAGTDPVPARATDS